MDDQHRAHAERNQDPGVQCPMRSLYVPRVHLRTDVLTTNRRTLSRGPAVEKGGRLYQGTHSEPFAARKPGAMGRSRAGPEPHGAGMDQLLRLWLGNEGAAGGTGAPVPCGSPLSPPATQGRWAWVSSVPSAARFWGTGRGFPRAASASPFCAYLSVKSVREPDDRNGHVRFDERGEETERWTSRRGRSRKTPLDLGAAGPVRYRASPRLHPTLDGIRCDSVRKCGRLKSRTEGRFCGLNSLRTTW